MIVRTSVNHCTIEYVGVMSIIQDEEHCILKSFPEQMMVASLDGDFYANYNEVILPLLGEDIRVLR